MSNCNRSTEMTAVKRSFLLFIITLDGNQVYMNKFVDCYDVLTVRLLTIFFFFWFFFLYVLTTSCNFGLQHYPSIKIDNNSYSIFMEKVKEDFALFMKLLFEVVLKLNKLRVQDTFVR